MHITDRSYNFGLRLIFLGFYVKFKLTVSLPCVCLHCLKRPNSEMTYTLLSVMLNPAHLLILIGK